MWKKYSLVDRIIIQYLDSRLDDRPGKPDDILKWSDDNKIMYRYTPDYWNKTYQPEIDKKLQDAAKNI